MNTSNNLPKQTQSGSSASVKRGLNFAYRVGNGIYINLTNRCSNSCTFCIRLGGDTAYGSDTLWLEREPESANEVVEAVKRIFFDDCEEFVFCGYGEPTYRADLIHEVGRILKQTYSLPIRLNTNGHGSIINGESISVLLAGVIDTVSISLNACDADSYQRVCRSVYGERAFDAMLDFAKECADIIPEVIFTAVDCALSDEELEKCAALVSTTGAKFRVRAYISDNNQI